MFIYFIYRYWNFIATYISMVNGIYSNIWLVVQGRDNSNFRGEETITRINILILDVDLSILVYYVVPILKRVLCIILDKVTSVHYGSLFDTGCMMME